MHGVGDSSELLARKRWFFPKLILLFAGWSGALLPAQGDLRWTRFKFPVKFAALGVEDGLSQGSVLAICQDRRGFMWFGTEDGLNRYDGYTFYVFRPERTNPGAISDNIISSIYEDSRGRLWIGTQGGGLNLFDQDTESFVSFRHNPQDDFSINSNSIHCILEDQLGRFWIATDGGGLCLMLPGRETGKPEFIRFIHDPHNPRSIGGDAVTSVFQDRAGTLWAGCDGGGLNRLVFDETGIRSLTFERFSVVPGDPATTGLDRVMDIEEDEMGNLWIGTANGLLFRDHESKAFRRFIPGSGDDTSLSHFFVRKLYKDRKGILWIGTDGGGLNRLDWAPGAERPRFVRFLNDPDNPHGIRSNAVESIYEDRSGTLWVGLYYGGVNKIVLRGDRPEERDREKFVHYQNAPRDPASLSSNFVNAICERPQGDLWIGTDGGGLNQVLPPSGPPRPLRFIHHRLDLSRPDSLSDDIITAIHCGRSGQLWVGTYTGGLNRVEADGKGRVRFAHFRHDPEKESSLSSDFVMSIYEDSRGVLWVGTIDGGLNRFNARDGTFSNWRFNLMNPRSINDDNVNAILEDSRGRLWVGTAEGLHLFDRDTGLFTRFLHNPADPGSISHDYIRVIFEDSRGRLWVGTNGGGLNRIDFTGIRGRPRFHRIDSEAGLPSQVIMGIIEDKAGLLWLGTGRGLSRLDPDLLTVVNFSSTNGVQIDEFNRNAFCRSHSGELLFGGKSGLYIFHPPDISQNPHRPPVVITGFQLFGKPVPIGKRVNGRVVLPQAINETKEIVMSSRDSVFSLEFAALNFIFSERNRYAYKMEGLDPDWNQMGGRRFVTFTTLPPGRYRFRVKASNNEGLWNETGTSLRIIVKPPLWRKWWFLVGMLLIAVMAGYLLYILRIRQLTRRQYALEGLVEQRTRELRDASLRDALTGLRNRRYIDEILLPELRYYLSRKTFNIRNEGDRRRLPEDGGIGILLVDIDHFKKLNDQHGHSSGDRYLVGFAEILHKSVRAEDVVIRMGGEEFLIVLKRSDITFLDAFTLRLKEIVEAKEVAADEAKLKRTCSIGYTHFPFYEAAPELIDFDRLLMILDAGLYYAKNHGRNLAVKVVPADSPPEPFVESQFNRVLELGPKNHYFSLLPFR